MIDAIKTWWKQKWCDHMGMFALDSNGETFVMCVKCGLKRRYS